jgi:hypothetical protein
MSEVDETSSQQLALIIQEPGKPHQVIVKFLMMILNYRYGLDLIVAHNFVEAFSTIQKQKNQICATFVIQRKKIDSSTSLAALNVEDTIPLFLVLPAVLMEEHKTLCHRMTNVYFGAWEKAFGGDETSLQSLIKSAFDSRGIGDLFKELEGASDEDARDRTQALAAGEFAGLCRQRSSGRLESQRGHRTAWQKEGWRHRAADQDDERTRQTRREHVRPQAFLGTLGRMCHDC